jgi:hypothetical protein
MKKLFDSFLIWLARVLQPLVERKFILKDTWELEKVENKGVKLPYVLFENKSTVINNFIIPVKLVRMRFDIINKETNAGRILFDGPVKIPPKSRKSISMEVRLNHFTALFNMLRFVFTTNNIQMQIKGEVQIKILGLDFFIPVTDVLDLPKNKVQMIINTIEKKTDISAIPFEDIDPMLSDITSIKDQNEAILNNMEVELERPKEEILISEILIENQKNTNSASDEHNPL